MIVLNLLAVMAAAGGPLPTPKPHAYEQWIGGADSRVYFSQNAQDAWMTAFTGYAKGGTFMEVGAFDGWTISNTAILEQAWGWDGICVEALPAAAARIAARRGCKLFNVAAYDSDGGEVVFEHLAWQEAEVFSGISEEFDPAHVARVDMIRSHFQSINASLSDTVKFRVPTRTISSMIDEAGLGPIVDLMSVDVEGGEYRALTGLDLRRHIVNVLFVEDNYSPLQGGVQVGGLDVSSAAGGSSSSSSKEEEVKRDARLLLEASGLYHPPRRWGQDWLFVRKQLRWSWEERRRRRL